jgi:hypothetical protein
MIRPLFSSIFRLNRIILPILLGLLSVITAQPSGAESNPSSPYVAVTGLADLRSTFSDGTHEIEEPNGRFQGI